MNMKQGILVLFAAAGMAALLNSCATPARAFDPEQQRTNIRSTRTVSGEELRLVAQGAVQDILNNARFKQYLSAYRQKVTDPTILPLLKLAKAQNRTDDPNLDMVVLTDLIKTELINSGLVDVTIAEGEDQDSSLAESRDLEYDDNFDRRTVAKRGTLQAAELVLRPRITSSRISEGGKTVVVRTFNIDVANITTGRVIFSHTRQLGVTKGRGSFGF